MKGANPMKKRGFWIRLTDGLTERWTVFAGDDGMAAHMSAAAFCEGTKWRVCWP
jgi:hypothetical protein